MILQKGVNTSREKVAIYKSTLSVLETENSFWIFWSVLCILKALQTCNIHTVRETNEYGSPAECGKNSDITICVVSKGTKCFRLYIESRFQFSNKNHYFHKQGSQIFCDQGIFFFFVFLKKKRNCNIIIPTLIRGMGDPAEVSKYIFFVLDYSSTSTEQE